MVLVLSLLSASARAEDGTGPNRSAEKAAMIPASPDVALLGDVIGMVDWGRANASPEVIAAAARILASIGVRPMTTAPRVEGDVAAGAPPALLDASALQAEAVRLAETQGRKGLAKVLKEPPPTTRGAVDGPQLSTRLLAGRAIDTYAIEFEGGKPAEVLVRGSGSSDVDLAIYDEYGNRVVFDASPGDLAFVGWVPRWSGTFLVQVTNLGSATNLYRLVTN